MRRHPVLRDLSSDHHLALVQAHRLKRASHADGETRRNLVREFFVFWHEHANRHFREEEEALLPFYVRWGDLDAEPIRQMQHEHVLIRSNVAQLRAASTLDADFLKTMGEQLEAHVRLEERQVFPLIENAIPASEFDALAAWLAAWRREEHAERAPEAERSAKVKAMEVLDESKETKSPAVNANGAASNGEVQPGGDLQTHKMPGHWLLARLGKTVLRPGGLELTRQLLAALAIQTTDSVVEFAPGLGATAQMAWEKSPASYIAIERDENAAQNLQKKFDTANREFIIGSADATDLPDHCATVVYGEAMLTMQTPDKKARIVQEAARLLKPGGRYGIHELCLVPDEMDEALEQEIAQALGGSIHVGARPLRVREWCALLENAGLEVTEEKRAPMELLEPARLIADEGLNGALNIVWNALHDQEALARIREMRAVFNKYQSHLSAIVLVAQKQ